MSQGGGFVTPALLRKQVPNIRVTLALALAPALSYECVSDFSRSSATIRTAYGATAEYFPPRRSWATER